jgi:hypothetical protein
MAAIAFLIWAALDREQEQTQENPKPTIGAPAPKGWSAYDEKGNYKSPGYEIEY